MKESRVKTKIMRIVDFILIKLLEDPEKLQEKNAEDGERLK